VSACSAYTLPTHYRPESRRCEMKVPNGVSVVDADKSKPVCWTHVREYQNKGNIIFKPRLMPQRIK